MTSFPDRAVCPSGPGTSSPAAHGTPGTASHPAVVPGVPELTVGVASPDLGAPTVHQPDGVWGAALSFRRTHFVPASHTEVEMNHGRPTKLGADGWPALIDEAGIEKAKTLPRCRACLASLQHRGEQP